MARNEAGVPQEIGDLSPVPFENRPWGSDAAYGPGSVTDDHMRALAAFVAQLHARVKELEDQLRST
jgi:hypothetical protein